MGRKLAVDAWGNTMLGTGGACYLAGLAAEAQCGGVPAGMILAAAVVLLSGAAAVFAADFWHWKAAARQMVREVEEFAGRQGDHHR